MEDWCRLFPSHHFSPAIIDLHQLQRDWPRTAVITESAGLLTYWEREKISSFKRDKRFYEWLGGRLAAKLAVMRQLGLDHTPSTLSELEIRNSESGRPWLSAPKTAPTTEPVEISISHSGRYGLAVAAGCPCGIDIQEDRDSLTRVRDHFCEDAEEAIMADLFPAIDTQLRLNLLWAAKEAVKKALSSTKMPAFLDIELLSSSSAANTTGSLKFSIYSNSHNGQLVSALCGLKETYGLALCLIDK